MSDVDKSIKVSTRAQELLAELQKPEVAGEKNLVSLWRPEYGSYMVEGTPGNGLNEGFVIALMKRHFQVAPTEATLTSSMTLKRI